MRSSIGSPASRDASGQEQVVKLAEAALPVAVGVYQQGRHGEAQALCRKILTILPDHFDALHLLGVSQVDCSQFEEAVATLTRAIALEPRSADAQSNLGTALINLGRYEEARACQERAVALRPDFPMALTNLGNTLMNLGQIEEAIAAHDRAIVLKPAYADAHCNRGMTLLLAERYEDAGRDFDRALALDPRHVQAMVGKGMANIQLRNYEPALASLNAALAIKPGAAAVLAQRGRLFQQNAELEKAEADFDAALKDDPLHEKALCGKIHVGLALGKFAQAMPLCNRVLEINPNSEVGLSLLGGCFAHLGDHLAAVAHFDRALAIKPDHGDAITRKIFALDFVPDVDFVALQAARKYWWDQVGAKSARRQLKARLLDPEKRIVIGYVSADFRDHSAALAFVPLLRHRDREQFEIICYSNSPVQDATTALCKSLADKWVDVWRLTDDGLADRIEADQVDILVDLSGHSGGNRLSMFAMKPAPIQVTAIGHVSGTGLPTMDYLLADPIVIPAEVRPLFTEKIHDLPAMITIEPPPDIPRSPLPMLANGHATFGVFNRTDKISDQALSVWSRLLRVVPDAIIVVKHGALDDVVVRDGLIGRFVASGIPEKRLRCIGSSPRGEHLKLISTIDIMLDPFPQNGGISTWEPLQLGVPVVSKLGNGHASRCGGAIVVAAGLSEWVAHDEEGYIEIARRWASNPEELAALRARLPQQVLSSAGGNSVTYTRHVEEGYRSFWRSYCASAGG